MKNAPNTSRNMLKKTRMNDDNNYNNKKKNKTPLYFEK